LRNHCLAICRQFGALRDYFRAKQGFYSVNPNVLLAAAGKKFAFITIFLQET
jgi:hypothetical protein